MIADQFAARTSAGADHVNLINPQVPCVCEQFEKTAGSRHGRRTGQGVLA